MLEGIPDNHHDSFECVSFEVEGNIIACSVYAVISVFWHRQKSEYLSKKLFNKVSLLAFEAISHIARVN